MKNRIIILFASAVLAVTVCVFSNFYVTKSMKTLNRMRNEAIKHSEKHDFEKALSKTEEMIAFIEKRSTVLEMLTPHEDLHDLIIALNDAHISLEIEDMDDYTKAISLFEENINHLIAHESISVNNVF